MIYFFHHYELPVIIQQAQVQQILRLRTRQRHQQQNGNGTQHGASNTAANMRNGSNAANQANNNAMGNNQVNNNGNQPNNNNHRNGNLFASISLIFNVRMISTLFTQIWNAFGVLQGRITNDVFGTATFFNNNNDNSLNNNNNPTANITRLRINLSRLRRINLAGIQINPIQINPADGTDNVHRHDGRDEIADDESAAVENRNAFNETSASHSNVPSNHTTTENDRRPIVNESDFNFPIKTTNEHSQQTFETVTPDDTDFDIIDASDEIEIKQNAERSNETAVTLNSNRNNESFDETERVTQVAAHPVDGSNERPLYLNDRPNAGTSFGCDIQLQNISNSSNAKIEACNTAGNTVDSNQLPTEALYTANALNATSSNDERDERLLQRSSDTVPYSQVKSLESFPNESHSWIQGDKPDHSLTNTNIGICTEIDGSVTRLSSHNVATLPPKLDVSNEAVSPKTNEIHMPGVESTMDSSSAQPTIPTTVTPTNIDEQNIESN